ncbi:hypothetical protein NC651_001824 [Populus alba x Populus x berolinensis]|nr:hypothetical protein NC651_001824 [Populus alba x Populus x berolinensis]
MAGSITSIFLLRFCSGGVVHRCHGWEIDALWWVLLVETRLVGSFLSQDRETSRR